MVIAELIKVARNICRGMVRYLRLSRKERLICDLLKKTSSAMVSKRPKVVPASYNHKSISLYLSSNRHTQ
jgi:hypothetical protein